MLNVLQSFARLLLENHDLLGSHLIVTHATLTSHLIRKLC